MSRANYKNSVLVKEEVSPIFQQLVSTPIVDRSIKRFDYILQSDAEGGAGVGGYYGKKGFKFNLQAGSRLSLVGKSYIEMKFRVALWNKIDSRIEELDPLDPTSVAANPLWLFDRVRLSINNKEFENLEEPGLVYQVKSCMEVPRVMLESTGIIEGFIPDKGTGINDDREFTFTTAAADPPAVPSITGVSRNEDYNRGYATRRNMTKASKWITVKIELDRIFEFCTQYKLPMTGIPVELELIKKQNPFQFINTCPSGINDRCWPRPLVDPVYSVQNPNWPAGAIEPTHEYFIDIKKMEWRVPILEVSPSVQASLYNLMSKKEMTNILYSNTKLIRGPVIGETNSITWDIAQLKTIPSDVSIVFIDSRVFARNARDAHVANANIFEHINMTQFSISVGGVRFPWDEYKLTFPPKQDIQPSYYDGGNENIMRLYRDFLESSRSCVGKSCLESCITYDEFMRFCTIFHFDLSYIDAELFDNESSHQLQLHADLSKSIPSDGIEKSVTGFALVSTERMVLLKMTPDRKTHFDFAGE